MVQEKHLEEASCTIPGDNENYASYNHAALTSGRCCERYTSSPEDIPSSYAKPSSTGLAPGLALHGTAVHVTPSSRAPAIHVLMDQLI
ncbi:hypothetical protein J6590_031452 [Homalodisca vitripennis]|nr:hypothetical protein J6590_031452 [Homalodisca vitripennis]